MPSRKPNPFSENAVSGNFPDKVSLSSARARCAARAPSPGSFLTRWYLGTTFLQPRLLSSTLFSEKAPFKDAFLTRLLSRTLSSTRLFSRTLLLEAFHSRLRRSTFKASRATGPLLYPTRTCALSRLRVCARPDVCVCAPALAFVCAPSLACSLMLCVRAVTPARVCALSLARLCAPLFVRVRARSPVCARAPSAWYLYMYLRTDGPAAPRDQTRATPAAQGRKASKRHRARATLAHALALLLPYSQ